MKQIDQNEARWKCQRMSKGKVGKDKDGEMEVPF